MDETFFAERFLLGLIIFYTSIIAFGILYFLFIGRKCKPSTLIPEPIYVINPYEIDRIKGQIQVILGPMFSGKTTELLRRIDRFNIANNRTLVIKHHKDTRYCDGDSIEEECVVSHDRRTHKAIRATILNNLEISDEIKVIGIDEGQFFEDIVDFSEKMANRGKVVIIAALDGTFQRKPFGKVLDLIPMADEITKLAAVCMKCYHDAPFSKRITEETEIEVIGGKDTYMSVCRRCYFSQDI